jgi:hypothetical protein
MVGQHERAHPLNSLPSPRSVRETLARNLIENRLLRRLLRVSEAVAQERIKQARESGGVHEK